MKTNSLTMKDKFKLSLIAGGVLVGFRVLRWLTDAQEWWQEKRQS